MPSAAGGGVYRRPLLAAGLAALALPVLSWLAVLLCRRKLRAELSCPASAEKGRSAAVRLTLRRPRALPVGRVRFHLAAENTVTGETACRRGRAPCPAVCAAA